MVVIGVSSSWIFVRGEGRNRWRSASWFVWELKTSSATPRGKDIDEINSFASIAQAQVKDNWRRRAREMISVGRDLLREAGTWTNLRSNMMSSRSGLERRSPVNFLKSNGVVYPTSFSSV